MAVPAGGMDERTGRGLADTFKAKTKPRKCPRCRSEKVAVILYGMPAFSRELEKELKDGKIVLGGCCITDNDPEWQCADCGAKIFRDKEIND